jgi:hypothetical protein
LCDYFHNAYAREIFIEDVSLLKLILAGAKWKYYLWAVTIISIFSVLLAACSNGSEEGCTANCSPPRTNSIKLTVNSTSVTTAGNITLSATVTGSINKVRFLKNGVVFTEINTASTITAIVPITTTDNGTLTVKAEGLSSSEVQIIVSINTPRPVSSIVLAVSPTTVNTAGEVTLNATVTGEITKVRFLKDGVALGAVDGSAPFAAKANLTETDNGTATFTAEGLNTSDEVMSTSNEVQVFISIQPESTPVNWTQLGGIAGIGEYVDIASDGNNTMIAFSDNDRNIVVRKWNGSTWQQVGSNVSEYNNGSSFKPSLVLDKSGSPIISWTESDGTSNNIYIKRFNGTSWSLIGENPLDLDLNQNASSSSLDLDSQGKPVIAWTESDNNDSWKLYVKRLYNETWQLVGGEAITKDVSFYASEPSLEIDNYDNPVVAWSGSDSRVNIFVSRFDGTSWRLVGEESLNINTDNNAFSPSLALDINGNAIVAWTEVDGEKSSTLYVKRFDGSTWNQLGNDSLKETFSAEHPSLVLDGSGNPIVAWQEDDGTYDSYIYVKQWTGSSWQVIGNNPISTPAYRSYAPSLTVTSTNIFVVWQSAISSASNIYVKEY